VTLRFDEGVGQGVGDHLVAWTFGPGRRGTLDKSMMSYERRPDYVALNRRGKGNPDWRDR